MRSVFHLVLLIIFSLQAKGQIDSIVTSNIQQLIDLWSKYTVEFELLGNYTDEHSLLFTPRIKDFDEKNLNYRSAWAQTNTSRQSLLKRDLGLQFSSNYLNNFQPLYDVEEDLIYRQRIQFGLDWNILQNGFYSNRLKAKLLENDKQLFMLSQRTEQQRRVQSIQTAAMIYYFNKEKLKILNNRRELNQEQTRLAEELFVLKHLNKEDYLKVLEKQTTISSQLQLYNNYNSAVTDYTKDQAGNEHYPLLNIKLESLMEAIKMRSDSTYHYELKNIELQNDLLNTVNLKFNTRYNYINSFSNGTGRGFLSFNIGFSAPLSFNSKMHQNNIDDQKKLLAAEYALKQTEHDNLEHAVLNHYYNYQSKLNQFLIATEKYNQRFEVFRMERAKQKMNSYDFHPFKALFLIDDLWDIEVEMLELKQEMYEILIAIIARLPDPASIETITEIYYENNQVKLHKSIYIWSNALFKYSEEFISEYCQLNNITRLIVSYKNESVYLKKLNKLLLDSPGEKIILIGNNNFLYEEDISNYLQEMSENILIGSIAGIHLDIEPQAMRDYKENIDSYHSRYLALVKAAASFCKDYKLKLEVSIPLTFPFPVLNSLSAMCDKLYLMVYENLKTDFVTRKTEEERKLPEKKLSLVLRAKDFSNRLEMDQTMKKFSTKLNIRDVAFHDFETLLKLDEKAIINSEPVKTMEQ